MYAFDKVEITEADYENFNKTYSVEPDVGNAAIYNRLYNSAYGYVLDCGLYKESKIEKRLHAAKRVFMQVGIVSFFMTEEMCRACVCNLLQ